jgi:hypothetical protein
VQWEQIVIEAVREQAEIKTVNSARFKATDESTSKLKGVRMELQRIQMRPDFRENSFFWGSHLDTAPKRHKSATSAYPNTTGSSNAGRLSKAESVSPAAKRSAAVRAAFSAATVRAFFFPAARLDCVLLRVLATADMLQDTATAI